MADTGGARRTGWRPLRIVMRLLLVLILAPYPLAILYRFIDAPSTLMIWTRLEGEAADRRFVPIGKISPHLVLAVATSEDAAFCGHFGIDLRQIRESVREAERGNAPLRGGSTITQQTAKNMFLWPGRSIVRKILEAPLSMWLTLIWPKSRVMEVYLNAVEWGPGVFGAEAAARRYFNIPASGLNAQQAALLATALPNPNKRNPASPSPGHARLAQRLLAKMQRVPANLECLR